jgi:putative membrane protein
MDGKTRRVAVRAAVALVVTLAAFGGLVAMAPDQAYLWIKALHIIAVIAWMAGMLYLPRLFVNHAEQPVGSPESELLKGMERRLLTIIVNPAMVVAWVLGLWLAWSVYGFSGGWLWAKLALVTALSAVHGFLSAAVRTFGEDRNRRSPRFWRIVNEMPALLMIGIVILVVVKPF